MPIIIPEKVNPLQLSYPDFTLGAIINPDEFDQNNLDIEEKLNEFIPVVNTTIDNTVEVVAIVTDANTKSDTAIATANGAVTTANTTVVTANTANTNASNAVSVANTANTNANTAVTIANGAVTTANNALNKATQVETDYNLIKPELEQAVLDVADKASTEYVDQQVANATIGVLPLNSITDNYLFDGVDHIKNRVAILRNEVNTLTDGQTAESILTKLKTVDGSGSGLDADLFGGQETAFYAKQSDVNYLNEKTGEFTMVRLNKDANDIYTEIQYKRQDGTLHKKSVLSGGTSPKYTTRTVTFYASNGTTVIETKVFALTYTGDDFTSEVIS